MKAINLVPALKKYKSGWVAIDKKSKVVAHSRSFGLIAKKAKGLKGVYLMPASDNYFGFITRSNA